MPLPVDLLLPIITVLATLRSQVANWFRSRAVPRPVQDLTVGTPVEFDDLTSECNKQEVRQHDYYDRRKETLNSKERTYAVAGDEDQYTNEALETLFSQAVEAGKGLHSLFASHEKESSDKPKDAAVMDEGSGDSKYDNAKDTAAETADKQMLPREAEARELYKLYEVPKEPKNNDQTSVTSTDSLDSRVRLPWRQWINHLRNNTISFGLRNPFRSLLKTFKGRSKAGTAGKEAARSGSEQQRGDSAERKVQEGNASRTKFKNPLRKRVFKYRRQQKQSVEQTKATTKDEDQIKNVLAESNQEKVPCQPLMTPANMYGTSAIPLPKCAWGHDDCDYIQEKIKLLGSLASRDHQPSHSVEPVQRIEPRSHGTKGPVPTTKKSKRLAWFTSRSKKASQRSGMKKRNRPVERRIAQVAGPSSIASGSAMHGMRFVGD